MDAFEKIANNVFRSYGLDLSTAERAVGWTNAVWLNGGYVLRVSKERGSERIRRDTERSKALPPSVGYPKNIALGVTDGYEWSLSERLPGMVLSSVWDSLDWMGKAAAIDQIIAIMNSVHSVDVSEVEHLTKKTAWYNPFDKTGSLADIERYIALKLFTPKQGRALSDILERFYNLNASVAPVLCHGDITTDNLLWHDHKIIALLDFEHAVIAPCQLDVHSVFNLALIPYDEAASKDIILFNDDRRDIKDYTAGMITVFKPFLATQSDKDLFLGYNVLFQQRFFEFWLDKPEGDLEQCDAYQKLLSFCDGGYGYLSKML